MLHSRWAHIKRLLYFLVNSAEKNLKFAKLIEKAIIINDDILTDPMWRNKIG